MNKCFKIGNNCRLKNKNFKKRKKMDLPACEDSYSLECYQLLTEIPAWE